MYATLAAYAGFFAAGTCLTRRAFARPGHFFAPAPSGAVRLALSTVAAAFVAATFFAGADLADAAFWTAATAFALGGIADSFRFNAVALRRGLGLRRTAVLIFRNDAAARLQAWRTFAAPPETSP